MIAAASLIWILPIGCALIALSFWLVWRHQNRSGSSGFACAGFAVCAVLTIADFQRAWLPGAVVLLLVPLHWFTIALLVQAFLVRVERTLPWRAIGAACALPAAWHYYFFMVDPNLLLRNLSSTLVCGMIILVGAKCLLRVRRNRLDAAIFSALAMVGIFYLLRALMMGDPAQVNGENWVWSPPMITLYAGNALAALAIALLLMLAIGTDLIAFQVNETRRDALTGIGNRRALDDAILADERGDATYTAAIMLDLDHFKRINDRYGHAAGDAVLVTTAQALAAGPGQQALLARIGGEEFALLVPASRHLVAPSVALVAQSTIAALTCAGVDMQVTASAGLALRLPNEDLRDTLRRADLALYRAKSEGRNRLIMADSETQERVAVFAR